MVTTREILYVLLITLAAGGAGSGDIEGQGNIYTYLPLLLLLLFSTNNTSCCQPICPSPWQNRCGGGFNNFF